MPEFLLRQRWYSAKDAGRPQVAAQVWLPFAIAGLETAVVVWRVTPPSEAAISIFAPVSVVPIGEADPAQTIARLPAPKESNDKNGGERAIVEAFSQEGFVHAWVNLLLGSGGNPAQPGFRAETTVHFEEVGIEPDGSWAVRRLAVEQSNTSIRIGERAILKVIRKLEEGAHPELEIGRFLTGEAGYQATPALLGWIELAAAARYSCTLSILQAFVPNQGDGWTWILDRLQQALAGDPQGFSEIQRWLVRLGQRTAQMHRAFSMDTAAPEFRPEPVSEEDAAQWRAAAQRTAQRAIDALADAGDRIDSRAKQGAATLLAQRMAVEERLAALCPNPGTFAKTRHHGDFHLGQVLVAGDDAVVIDFEGEPLRPLAERRAKRAGLRDVAGMLRSFAYVAVTAERKLPEITPAAEREAAQDRLAAWQREAVQTFVEAYFEAAQGSPGVPADRTEAERVLRFFMLEKALYEVAYEVGNRPNWAAIPLNGVLALLHDDEGVTPLRRSHGMPFGAELRANGAVRFRLWAPRHDAVRIEIEGGSEPLPMQRLEQGWHELVTNRAGPGARYRFLLPDGKAVPDPASRHQPEDVHGPSEVIDPSAHTWLDSSWRGRPWTEAVVYELHVGAFTPEGTFRAAIDKLDHLVGLGVTAIELMPIGDFPGSRNWGYDGVLPYAPDSSYGRPEDLKALIEAAHARGVMVLLDVVYNHFGPEGSYLPTIAPEFFTHRHETPWGAALNMDDPAARPVREYFIQNALYWLEEFHVDGLRLDAVHAILDDSDRHLLRELAERVRSAIPDRHIHLILENEENQASRLERNGDGKPRWYTAQWNDDVHHTLHVAATGESGGYYVDYAGNTERLGRALAEGFAFQGELMKFRGNVRGEPSAGLPPTAFIAFLQNHDQIGNRAFGDRLTAIAPAEAVRAVAAVHLLLPQIPLLFMGEEWGAAQPFPFFCDFGAELAAAVREGRREEFAHFPEFRDPAMRAYIPDPTAEATFASAKLIWQDAFREPHVGILAWYRDMLALRHRQIVPRLPAIAHGGDYSVIGDGAVVVRWDIGSEGALVVAANLSAVAVSGFPPANGRVIHYEGEANPDGSFAPWTVRWSIEGPSERGQQEGGREKRENSALDALAERVGIEAEFRNARGEMVRAEADTKRRLLGAMGFTVEDDHQACQALGQLDRHDWLRALPPVQVVGTGADPAAIDLVLPAQTGTVVWRIALEEGGERSGSADFPALRQIASREIDGRLLERRRLVVPDDLPWGYHRLSVTPGDNEMTLIVTPGRCWLPEVLEDGARLWGIAVQLYLLRSATNWGIGDFGDLRELVTLAASNGADVIGLNPLHAMFHDDPEHASPYSPASRLMLNILNIDVTAVPELAQCDAARELIGSEAFRQDLAACRGRDLVDYAGVTQLKLKALDLLFEASRKAPDQTSWRQFEVFRRERGEVLESGCLFLALREHFAAESPAWADWHAWPEEYRDPDAPAVRRFAEDNAPRLDFLAWLQWVADEQLSAAAAETKTRGMAVGLYRDLAVGGDAAGAETWANSAAVISGAQVGAPPDLYNPAGQDWGLPPFHPQALREEAYRSFVQLVRANMRHAGGLRIDHVMGLQHLYWVPAGQSPALGAYVQYPTDDLVAILALESHRHRCLVVGEDLGTVPEGFRERMAAANVLSYRVLFFEQETETGAFVSPEDYPRLALAVVGSHDLPTLRGWWEGRDLDLKERLGLFPGEDEATRQRDTRIRDQGELVKALRRESLIDPDGDLDTRLLARAAHAYLARTPSMIAMVQIDDLTDEVEPVNVPATSHEHPNWRRRLSMTIEDLSSRTRFGDIAEIFRVARGGSRDRGKGDA